MGYNWNLVISKFTAVSAKAVMLLISTKSYVSKCWGFTVNEHGYKCKITKMTKCISYCTALCWNIHISCSAFQHFPCLKWWALAGVFVCIRWLESGFVWKAQNSLVGQIREMGHGDSWEAVGKLQKNRNKWFTCVWQTHRECTGDLGIYAIRFALMSQSQTTVPVAHSPKCAALTFCALLMPYILVTWSHCFSHAHTHTLICTGCVFYVTLIYDCALSYF